MKSPSMAASAAGCLTLVALLACPSPPPPPPGTASAVPPGGGPANFTATVTNAPPTTWTYTVTSATASPITSIEIVAPVDLSKCTLTPPTVPAATGGAAATWKTTTYKTPAGKSVPTGFSDPVGLATVTFTIVCDARNGPIYLYVTDAAGTASSVMNAAGASLIGPLAGPT